MRTILVCALLMLTSWCPAADIDLPKEVKARAGEFVQIKASAIGDVEWYVMDPGIQFLPFELLKDRKTAILFTLNTGTFRVLAWSAKDNKPTPAALCVVTIEGLSPFPPAPPVPPAPEPTALEKRLRPFLMHDPDAKRLEQVKVLASFFEEMKKISEDGAVKTVGELFQQGSVVSEKMIGNDWLVLLRREINLYLDETLPRVAAQELDDKTRKLCVKTFEDLALTLKRLGG